MYHVLFIPFLNEVIVIMNFGSHCFNLDLVFFSQFANGIIIFVFLIRQSAFNIKIWKYSHEITTPKRRQLTHT